MKNQIIKLKCIDMSVDGQGICKHEGLVVFVKGMILDEVALVKVIAHKKNLAYGIIDKLIEPSKYRIESSCPISYKCGGCDYRYIDYNYQLYLKQRALINTFKNFNLTVEVKEVLPSPLHDYYRNKTQIPVKDKKFGFYRKYSNDIVEFAKCFIETELANNILNDLKPLILKNHLDEYLRHIIIKDCMGTNEVMIAFIVSKFTSFDSVIEPITTKYPNIKSIILNLNDKDTNVVLGNEEKVIYGNSYVIDEFAGLKFKISLKSFYQVNYHQMLNLYTLAKDLANITKEDSVLDLYSGIGTISLFLSKYAKDVTGVEVVEAAVLNAKENAKINNINNATFYLDDAKNPMDKYIAQKDIVIVDPPRKGLSSSLIESLKKADIKKLVYISCGPSTLVRDLALLKESYHFDTIYPVDMFPNTVHCECVVLMSRVTTPEIATISKQ